MNVMKKIISIASVFIFIFTFSLLSVNAETSTEDKLINYIKEKVTPMEPYYYEYKELYNHQNDEGETDWILLYVVGSESMPWDICGVFNHRVVFSYAEYTLFSLCLGLYDVNEDTFYDLTTITDYGKYNGLAEAIDMYGTGRLLGDIDNDDSISVLDCTALQRCAAGLSKYPANDTIEPHYVKYEKTDTPLKYYSDFNRDGERSIIDVTCMQRYLAGMPYPIG